MVAVPGQLAKINSRVVEVEAALCWQVQAAQEEAEAPPVLSGVEEVGPLEAQQLAALVGAEARLQPVSEAEVVAHWASPER